MLAWHNDHVNHHRGQAGPSPNELGAKQTRPYTYARRGGCVMVVDIHGPATRGYDVYEYVEETADVCMLNGYQCATHARTDTYTYGYIRSLD